MMVKRCFFYYYLFNSKWFYYCNIYPIVLSFSFGGLDPGVRIIEDQKSRIKITWKTKVDPVLQI